MAALIFNMEKLDEMTSKALKEIAKNLHISGWWKLKKEDLIAAISSMTEKEKIEAKKEEEIEKQLFDHYQKNWSKYGPKNDWVKFLKDYKKGKIELIEDNSQVVKSETEAEPETEIESISSPAELEETEVFESNKPDKPDKPTTVKKPSLKIKELTFNGKTQTIKEWAAELNMPWPTLYDRVNRNGWTIEKALTTPVRKRG